MIQQLPLNRVRRSVEPQSPCEFRSVSKDGRIVCKKIAEGADTVSPEVCRACPFQTVDCAHLRFSLTCSSPSPLVVRFNGRTEVWDDGMPEIRFEQAACAARVIPILRPEACADCPLRQPVSQPDTHVAARHPAPVPGKVVPFPHRQSVSAAG
jgi:hypothetical protein